MPTAHGFTAHIEIGGNNATEYAVEHGRDNDGNPTATCWIASETGKKFTINWKDDNFSFTTRGHIYVDGERVGSRHVHSAAQNKKQFVGWRNGHSTRTALQFSTITLTDEEDSLDSAEALALGDIKIQIYRTHIISIRDGWRRSFDRPSLGTKKVNEKAKKGLVHHIQGGPALRCQGARRVNSHDHGPPIITFSFKYRPLDVLRANDIAPRPAAPVIMSNEIIELTDDEDDMAEEERRLEARLAAIRRAKRSAVKAEADVKPLILDSTIVDLT